MRTLNKNKRTLYYKNPTGEERITIDGKLTPDMRNTYGELTELKCNYSASTGQETVEIFGNTTNYSKTIVLSPCPLIEGSLVWIDKDTSGEANYKVVRVANSLNHTVLALREIK